MSDPFLDNPDLVACAELVRRGDPDRFAATMAAPVAPRALLFPLYAFNLEVSRAPWVTQEPLIAEMRLQWWRDALGEIAGGGFVRRHEVVTPLAQGLGAEDARALQPLIDARSWDIERAPFADELAFERYIDDTGGALMEVAARMLGADEAQAVSARQIGYATGLAAFFRAVPELEAQGRVPMVDGRAQAVAALAQEGLSRLDKGLRAGIPVKLRPAILPAFQTRALLRQAAKAPQKVKAGALGLSEFRRRARLLGAGLLGRF